MAASTDLSTDERVGRIALSLHNAGYAVRVVGRERMASAPLNAKPYARQRLSMWFERGPLFYAELNIRLVIELIHIKDGILVANDMDTLPAMALIAWVRRLQLVFDAHEYFSQVPELQHKPIVRRFWEVLERRLIPHANLCYTVGPALAERFTALYGKPFASIKNVPGTAVIPSPLTSRTPRHIIYVGALNKGRGLEALLHALHRLPRYTATLVGYGDIEAQLHQLAKELNLQARVQFTGKLTRGEYLPLLAQASIGYSLLQPIGLSYTYSLSNKFFEYLAAGLPQLYPNLPEYERIAEGYTVGQALPASADAIVEALRAFDDPVAYESMVINSLKLSQQHTWAEEEKKLLALYASV